mgnify:CR=1 FL=1
MLLFNLEVPACPLRPKHNVDVEWGYRSQNGSLAWCNRHGRRRDLENAGAQAHSVAYVPGLGRFPRTGLVRCKLTRVRQSFNLEVVSLGRLVDPPHTVRLHSVLRVSDRHRRH